jgi:pyruvate dehydrogenase kinase 2/3/4
MESKILSQTTLNPSVRMGQYRSSPGSTGKENGNPIAKTSSRRYYVAADDGREWPPELSYYNKRFAQVLEGIKRRHDSVVTTVGRDVSTPCTGQV